jgi:hypothetical protein
VEKENDIQRLHSELEAAKTSAALIKAEEDQEESTDRLLEAKGIITNLENRHKEQEQKIGIVNLIKAKLEKFIENWLSSKLEGSLCEGWCPFKTGGFPAYQFKIDSTLAGSLKWLGNTYNYLQLQTFN